MKKYFPLLFFIIISCTKKPDALPNWVSYTKSDVETWVGIGIGLNREIAIQKATNAIASQISIQIESNIKSIKAERNFEIEQYSHSIIESHVNISLPEVVIDEVIYLNNNWYAKAILNKIKYYKILENKRQNAKDLAIKILENQTNLSKSDEITSLFKAYQEIKNYLDVPILINLNGKKNVNLYTEILTRFQQSIRSISIIPENDFFKLKSIIPINKNILIQIISKNNKSTDGLPFFVEFDSGETSNRLSTIDNKVNLTIKKIYSNNPNDIIKIGLDLTTLLNSKEIPQSFQIQNIKEITIETLPLNIYINTVEKNLGNPLIHNKINPVITQYFIDKYSAVIKNDIKNCDIKIISNINTIKGNDNQNEWGIYKTLADFNIIVTACDSNQELFKYSLNNIQGGDFESYKHAGNQAINNLVNHLKENILPEIDKSFSQI